MYVTVEVRRLLYVSTYFPDDLLVNLSESREVVDALLDALPTMFQSTRKQEVALGPALVAAYRIMSHIGGKMCVFVSNLPSKGEASLKKHREDLRKMGTPEEFHQLNPDEQRRRRGGVL